MAPTSDAGLLVVGSDVVFAFGDAQFHGSTGGLPSTGHRGMAPRRRRATGWSAPTVRLRLRRRQFHGSTGGLPQPAHRGHGTTPTAGLLAGGRRWRHLQLLMALTRSAHDPGLPGSSPVVALFEQVFDGPRRGPSGPPGPIVASCSRPSCSTRSPSHRRDVGPHQRTGRPRTCGLIINGMGRLGELNGGSARSSSSGVGPQNRAVRRGQGSSRSNRRSTAPGVVVRVAMPRLASMARNCPTPRALPVPLRGQASGSSSDRSSAALTGPAPVGGIARRMLPVRPDRLPVVGQSDELERQAVPAGSWLNSRSPATAGRRQAWSAAGVRLRPCRNKVRNRSSMVRK